MEGLLAGKFQVPWGIVGKKETDTAASAASEEIGLEEQQ